MTTKEKSIDGQKVKITAAGYVYIDGIKCVATKYTPLVHPRCGMTDAQYEFVHDWLDHNYVMV